MKLPEEIKQDSGVGIAQRSIEMDYKLLKADFDILKKEHEELKKQHKTTVDYIDNLNRAKLGPIILEKTKYTMEDVVKMSTPEMDSLVNTLKVVKNAVAGVGADETVSPNASGLTAGSRYKFDKDTAKPKLFDGRG